MCLNRRQGLLRDDPPWWRPLGALPDYLQIEEVRPWLRHGLDTHKQHVIAILTHLFMVLLCFHRGLIGSGFTETHYLQDGTHVSLTRNHTVIPAPLHQFNSVLLNLCLNFVANFL